VSAWSKAHTDSLQTCPTALKALSDGLAKNLLLLALQDFTIIDGKGTLGATSFMNIFSAAVNAHKKS